MKIVAFAQTVVLIYFMMAFSQTAKDFTANDTKGKEHHLFKYLDDKKCVLVNFTATW